MAAGIGVAVVPPLAVRDQHDGQRGRDQTEALSRPSPIKGSFLNYVSIFLAIFDPYLQFHLIAKQPSS